MKNNNGDKKSAATMVSWRDMEPCGMGLQVLDDVDIASADADTALAAIGSLEQVIAHAQAMQMAWMNRFLDHRLAPGSRYSKYAAAEVAAELTWSTQTADKRLSLAYQLGSTLQRTWGAMYLGEIDLTKARALADIIAPLDVDKARLVEDELLPKAGERTVRWVRDKTRKQVLRIDPDGAEARRKERAKERRVEKSPDDDGMSWLSAYLPADKVEAAYRRVDAIAHSLKTREDPRSLDEVRADVLIDLLLGNPSNVTTKIEVRVDDPDGGSTALAEAEGATKKQAQQEAARIAFERLIAGNNSNPTPTSTEVAQ